LRIKRCFLIEKKNPDILIDFSIDKGHIFNKKSNIKLDRLSLTGSFNNGKHKGPENSVLLIKGKMSSIGSSRLIPSSFDNRKF